MQSKSLPRFVSVAFATSFLTQFRVALVDETTSRTKVKIGRRVQIGASPNSHQKRTAANCGNGGGKVGRS